MSILSFNGKYSNFQICNMNQSIQTLCRYNIHKNSNFISTAKPFGRNNYNIMCNYRTCGHCVCYGRYYRPNVCKIYVLVLHFMSEGHTHKLSQSSCLDNTTLLFLRHYKSTRYWIESA